MLGFILGALFVAALPPFRRQPPLVVPPRSVELTRPAPARQPQPLTTIEAVFEEWHKFAVWEGDTTEVALWNSDSRDFVDYFEVRRVGTVYYYRSLTALTRRPFMPPKLPPESPLRFTETEERYRERLEQGGGVDWRRPVEVPPRATPPKIEYPALTPPGPRTELEPETRK